MLRFGVFLCVSLFAFCAFAGEYVFVANTDSGDVYQVSVPGHEVVGKLEVGAYIDNLAFSHDRKTLYVNRIESIGLPQAKNVGEWGELVAFEPITKKEKWRMRLEGMPHHHIVLPGDKYVVVPLFDRLFAVVVDVDKQSVVQKIPCGWGGHGLFLSPDQETLYIGSMMVDHIAVVDVGLRIPTGFIQFKEGVRPFQISQDGKTLYVQLSRLNGFEVVDVASEKILQTVEHPSLPEGVELPRVYPHTVCHGLAITPDQRHILSAGTLAGAVHVYTLPDLGYVTSIQVGDEPKWIDCSSDSKFAYVSNRNSNTLSVISLDEMKEVKQIEVGKYPQRLTVVTLDD